MDTTTKKALRGVKMLRWWRRYRLRVAITITGILIICAMGGFIKVAASESNETVPSVRSSKSKEITIITQETVDVLPVVETDSNEHNIQQYMAEEFEISSINYYAANNRSTGYYTEVVVNSDTQVEEQKTYTYLGRTYSEEDVQNIARIAWFEQGICGKEMTQLAAAVLINRSHWTEFGSTYLDCFYQAGQYSTYTINRYESSEEIPDEVYDWIVELLNGESQYGEVPTNVVFQSQLPQGIGTYETAANTYICYADVDSLGEYIP